MSSRDANGKIPDTHIDAETNKKSYPISTLDLEKKTEEALKKT